MKQKMWESDDDFKKRVRKERASQIGIQQRMWETDEDYLHRAEVEFAKSTGVKQGFWESDDDFIERGKKAFGENLGVKQKLWESDSNYYKRVENKVADDYEIKQRMWETDEDFSNRLFKEIAEEIDTNSNPKHASTNFYNHRNIDSNIYTNESIKNNFNQTSSDTNGGIMRTTMMFWIVTLVMSLGIIILLELCVFPMMLEITSSFFELGVFGSPIFAIIGFCFSNIKWFKEYSGYYTIKNYILSIIITTIFAFVGFFLTSIGIAVVILGFTIWIVLSVMSWF